MQITLGRVVGMLALLLAVAVTPAQAQRVRVSVGYSSQAFIPGSGLTGTSLQTTVSAPDGGTATLGGYSQLSEGRNESGAPGWGKGGFSWGRGSRNVGYGRSVSTRRITTSVRIIDLREEEYRQTGVRSR
jgi:hypothetical protein